MQIFVTLIAFVVAISVLIIFHELGHYLAAKLCNVKVLRFSIGFGKPLWARKYGQDLTEWTVCLLPLGGFVRMLDEREGDVFPEEAHRAFNRQSVWHRIFIVCAGPFSNLILAILIYTSMFIYGVPGVRPVIGYVAPGSIATKINLVPGDVIYSINGHPILTWQSMAVRLTEAAATGHSINLIVSKNKAKTHIVLNSKLLTTVSLDQNLVKQLGIFPPEPFVPGVLGTVEPGSPAAKAGLVAGDKIMAIEGRAFTNWENLVAVVRSEPNKPVQLVVSHGKQTSYATVTPRLIYVHHQKRGWIGVGPLVDPVQVNALRIIEHDTV
ncbi:MAG: RIP metalloprotease RseP, partial [Pseudomonadota bacterium]|nr:RIP metalloprotease RseP [Pseudomonadota bacterium]